MRGNRVAITMARNIYHNATGTTTLVERKTRYVMLAKVNNKDSETVINALVKHAQAGT
jgi:IS30 family transposase